MKKILTILILLGYSSLALGIGNYTAFLPPPKTKQQQVDEKKKIDCSLKKNKTNKYCQKKEKK